MAAQRKKTDLQNSLTLPPQNIEAEESLISSILVDNSALYEIIEILSPENFYRSNHQKIFAAIIKLFERSEPVDLITLSNELKNRNQLEEIGGASYLAGLIDTVPLAINVRHYANIVYEKSCLRSLIQKSNTIIQKCFEDTGDFEGVVDFAERAIFEISENKSRQAFTPISQIIDINIEMLAEKQANKSMITGVPSDFVDLDRYTSGFQRSDLIILAARPSMGKTSLALNIARNAAVEHNVPVAIFSLEMSKEQLSMRMLCAESRIDSSRLRSGFFSRDDWDTITEVAGVLSEAPIFIDDSPVISAMEIRAKARRLKMDKNIGLIIIDYLQLMRANRTLERRDLEISDISRSLKALAKELDLPVMALSQLNRMLEQRNDKRPKLSDLRESGALEQDADVVAFIYRDEVYNKEENNPHKGTAEIILAKQRNGPTGTATLAFLNTYTRFENYISKNVH
ncbi:MAG: replicative DNA helicase [Proteobacteria bacterium]|nr:replicative DNA helicase [Pseudomonadota bacterium]MBU4469980.1 replicative DNA helicase [Pseudomonadota bacterium]MCG2753742.1 replicative DNA helicase [Desulfobacteraceae bacterium]